MKNTDASEIIESFESSFQDKCIIPLELEMIWLKKAIGKYSYEIEPLNYDEELMSFDISLDRYVIDTLAGMMKKYYQERELSKVNKRVSIVGKDLSINSGMSSSKYAENELIKISNEVDEMLYKQTPSAYN